jgi:hypothetical protein
MGRGLRAVFLDNWDAQEHSVFDEHAEVQERQDGETVTGREEEDDAE